MRASDHHAAARTSRCLSLALAWFCLVSGVAACVSGEDGSRITLTAESEEHTISHASAYFVDATGLQYHFVYEPEYDGMLSLYHRKPYRGSLYIVSSESNIEPGQKSSYIHTDIGYDYEVLAFDEHDLTVLFTKRGKELERCLIGNSDAQVDANQLTYGHQGIFHIFVDGDLYETPAARDMYISFRLEQSQQEYDYLSSVFGFEPPTERILHVVLPTSIAGFSGAYAGAFFVVSGVEDDSQLTEEWLRDVSDIYAPHEFVHVFFAGVRDYCDFEEGLADFMRDLMNRDNPNLWKVKCSENGWQHVYVGEQGDIRPASEIVPYFDFSKPTDRQAEYYSRQSRGSYYKSGQCFWQYIHDQYGLEGIGKIARARHELRLEFPPTFKSFIGDIVNESIDADLRTFMKDRFNYVE